LPLYLSVEGERGAELVRSISGYKKLRKVTCSASEENEDNVNWGVRNEPSKEQRSRD
jgi:hypothetical protein